MGCLLAQTRSRDGEIAWLRRTHRLGPGDDRERVIVSQDRADRDRTHWDLRLRTVAGVIDANLPLHTLALNQVKSRSSAIQPGAARTPRRCLRQARLKRFAVPRPSPAAANAPPDTPRRSGRARTRLPPPSTAEEAAHPIRS